MTPPLAPQDLDLSQFEGATPGPWISDSMGSDFIAVYSDDATGSIVAQVGKFPYAPRRAAEIVANQHLIAAAPDLLAEVIRLRAEVEASARDAARYRWLRERSPIESFGPAIYVRQGIYKEGYFQREHFPFREELDAAIDAQLAAPLPSTAASEAAGAGE